MDKMNKCECYGKGWSLEIARKDVSNGFLVRHYKMYLHLYFNYVKR